MSKRKRRLQIAEKVIKTAAYLYIMYACLWAICHLVGDILGKMGVG